MVFCIIRTAGPLDRVVMAPSMMDQLLLKLNMIRYCR